MSGPCVDIGIPVYVRASCVADAIESVLSQTTPTGSLQFQRSRDQRSR